MLAALPAVMELISAQAGGAPSDEAAQALVQLLRAAKVQDAAGRLAGCTKALLAWAGKPFGADDVRVWPGRRELTWHPCASQPAMVGAHLSRLSPDLPDAALEVELDLGAFSRRGGR
jgi:hypothetical protein